MRGSVKLFSRRVFFRGSGCYPLAIFPVLLSSDVDNAIPTLILCHHILEDV